MAGPYDFPPKIGSQLVTASTTFANVGGLTADLVAGGTYTFEAWGTWSASAISTTLKLAMGGTATPDSAVLSYLVSMQTAAAGTSVNKAHYSTLNLGSGGTASAAAGAASVNYGWGIQGLILATASGTLTVQAAFGVTAATIKAGAVLLVKQIA